MRRIGRDELQTSISVSLKTASKVDVRKYKSKLPHESDEGAGALAQRICDLIDNARTMVIAADMVDGSPHGKNLGKFGVAEPDPCA
jgi:hypothetical protein